MWAAFFNFVAIMIFHLKVASTVGKGIVDPAVVDSHLIFGALIGAISWNVITWYYGLPSSSSHALIGGLVGSTMAKAGTGPLLAPGIIKTASFIVVAPLLGMLLSGIIIVALSWICRRRTQTQTDRGSAAAARVVGAVQHRPRQQRRAEDDGHHLAAAHVADLTHPTTCRTGS
jgi:PiT family inorganic phosphate transporter